ncbi:MAG TPA: hypothetical protein VM369_09485 [Candidatus Binatia bacterium]|nr:hypothetical protein [Candidatus Binatia bacterium]
MKTPDFARLGPPPFERKDLLFLFEHFPVPGVNAEAAVRMVHERPSTLDSVLDSRYLFEAIRDHNVSWLEVSPRLFFSVLLRRALGGRRRRAEERRTLHYVAHLLELFTRADRLYRVQPGEPQTYEYVVDLVQEAAQAGPERAFAVQSHIGNYALFLAGMCRPWIEHRHRYGRRPVDVQYYCRMGRGYYFMASRHRMAEQLGLREVFGELAGRFDYYRDGLERMAAEYLPH